MSDSEIKASVPPLLSFREVHDSWLASGDQSVTVHGVRALVSISNNGADFSDSDGDSVDTLYAQTFRYTESILVTGVSPQVIPEGAEVDIHVEGSGFLGSPAAPEMTLHVAFRALLLY